MSAIADVAHCLGLRVFHNHRASGDVDGVPTTLSTGGATTIEVHCELALPIVADAVIQERRGRAGGWSLGLGLDELLIGTSDAGVLGTLLADAQVYPRLTDLIALCRSFDLRTRHLRVRLGRDRAPEHLAYEVRLVAGLARALQWRMLWHWEALALEWGLRFEPGRATLDGVHEGVQIAVRYLWEDPARTVITCPLLTALPPQTHIGHPGVHRDAVEVGDPILDPMLALHSSDAAVLGDRIRDDAVRGPLLALVREFPGSIVLETELHLVVRGLLSDPLRDRVQLAVDVVRALG